MARSAAQAQEQPSSLRLLLACGVVGPLLFIVVFLIEGATRPDYNAWRHYVSSLSQGELGWMQITNFVICGGLMLGFALGLRRVLHPGKGATWGPILLASFGLGLIGAGLFVTDTYLDYPPGAPVTQTVHGTLHSVFSLVVFAALPAACFVLARRFTSDPGWRGWATYSIATGILVLVFLVLSDLAALAASSAPDSLAGFWQRASIITGWGWIIVLALRLLRSGPPEAAQAR